MANFLLLYMGGGAPPATEAERAAVMQEWIDWFTKLGSAVVDSGNPTAPMAKSIAGNGSVSDVPAGATMVTGYSVLAADSLDAAVAMAKSCPQLNGGGVQVYETFDVM